MLQVPNLLMLLIEVLIGSDDSSKHTFNKMSDNKMCQRSDWTNIQVHTETGTSTLDIPLSMIDSTTVNACNAHHHVQYSAAIRSRAPSLEPSYLCG